MKKCSKCNEVFDKSQFSKCRNSKDGLKNICKKCQKEYRSEYYCKNREKEIQNVTIYNQDHNEEKFEYNKKYRLENKDAISLFSKEYYAQHKDTLRRSSMEYYYKHKKDRNDYSRKWKSQNREKIREYQRDRLKNDINYKISSYARNRVRSALKSGDSSKTKNTFDLIGCSVDFLKDYLESKFTKGMTWENYGYYGWHIDHIKPCSSFDLTTEEQQRECFCYTNLQPLWWGDNLSKGDKIKS